MSRALDDLEELLLPAAFAIGGLYLVYWVTKSTTQLAEASWDIPEALVNYDLPFVGEGDFIDRWTYNPGELRRDVGRFRKWAGRYL
mgnify:CR=1 FL=1|jgi:hypothetical protein